MSLKVKLVDYGLINYHGEHMNFGPLTPINTIASISYVSDVVCCDSLDKLPLVGDLSAIYLVDGYRYVWTGTTYIQVTFENATWDAVTRELADCADNNKWSRLFKLSKDNPDSPHHFQYQRVVNRWFGLFMFVMLYILLYSNLPQHGHPFFGTMVFTATVMVFAVLLLLIARGKDMALGLVGLAKDAIRPLINFFIHGE